jgi:hypothetical protein
MLAADDQDLSQAGGNLWKRKALQHMVADLTLYPTSR